MPDILPPGQNITNSPLGSLPSWATTVLGIVAAALTYAGTVLPSPWGGVCTGIAGALAMLGFYTIPGPTK